MRVEPYAVGSYLHVLKRGARGLPITKSKSDQWRFIRLLYYMNDAYSDVNWDKVTRKISLFHRPNGWPEQKPLTKILGYCLMPNHFHLILKEVVKGGVSLFMKKLCESMTKHFNEKYDEKGSIFQGAYKSRTVETDEYLRYLAVYVMLKNPLELYPRGGFAGAMRNFDAAWNWATNFQFSSLADYSAGERSSVIVDKDLLGEIFVKSSSLKSFAEDCILGRKLNERTFLDI